MPLINCIKNTSESIQIRSWSSGKSIWFWKKSIHSFFSDKAGKIIKFESSFGIHIYCPYSCEAWSNVKESKRSSSVNFIMYWVSLQNIMHLSALITGFFLFPLLELAEILSLLFKKGNVACQFERLLPSVLTQLGINRCNFHNSQVQSYTETLLHYFPFCNIIIPLPQLSFSMSLISLHL